MKQYRCIQIQDRKCFPFKLQFFNSFEQRYEFYNRNQYVSQIIKRRPMIIDKPRDKNQADIKNDVQGLTK